MKQTKVLKQKLPHGKYKWIIELHKRKSKYYFNELLEKETSRLESCVKTLKSASRIKYKDYTNEKVPETILLENIDDLLILKIAFPGLIYKVKEIVLSF